MSEKMKIKVIIGSTRPGRFSERPARWIFEELQKEVTVEAELLDLRDFPMPFFDAVMPPSMAGGVYENDVITKWAEKVKSADGYIIVSPEYNHSFPAVLKNALDVLGAEWARKPIGFVSYGGASGARVVEQLRLVAGELNMAPIRQALHIPVDIFMGHMMGTGPQGSEAFVPMRTGQTDHVANFFTNLLWWAEALNTARSKN